MLSSSFENEIITMIWENTRERCGNELVVELVTRSHCQGLTAHDLNAGTSKNKNKAGGREKNTRYVANPSEPRLTRRTERCPDGPTPASPSPVHVGGGERTTIIQRTVSRDLSFTRSDARRRVGLRGRGRQLTYAHSYHGSLYLYIPRCHEIC